MSPFLTASLILTLRAAPIPTTDGRDIEQGVVAAVNAERAKRGAAALSRSDALDGAARERAGAVASAEDAASAEISGDALARLVERHGYEDRAVAELVLVGGTDVAERLERLAESSPDEFAEAVSAQYRDLGVGVLPTEGGGFVWALVFGLSVGDDFRTKTAGLSDLTAVRKRMLERVNAERGARRLAPLRENGSLDVAAQAHADDMIRRSYYGHASPEGTSALDRAYRAGYGAVAVGENIAEGQTSVDEVVESWMESAVHRAEILSVTMKEIGIGLAYGKNARGWQIVWVQDFGVPRAADTSRARRRPR